jgi:hypothetical protein
MPRIGEDLVAMPERDLVDPTRLPGCFDEIEPQLYRFPAIDPDDYRRRDSRRRLRNRSRAAPDPLFAAFVDLLLPERHALLEGVDRVAAR